MMKVLVTGARGFTGRYVCEQLGRLGYEVVPLTVNILDRDALVSFVQGATPDFVLHLAAISFVPNSTGEAVYATNVIGTENLLIAASSLTVKPQRVILASSSHVYGQNAEPVETDCPKPINHYGVSKLAMECIAATFQDKLNIVITRPFTYTGVSQADHYLVPKLVKHFRSRSPVIELGNVSLSRDFSDVRWVAKVYGALISRPLRHDIYNVGSGVAYSLQEIIHYLSAKTDHYPDIVQNPAFMRSNDILIQKSQQLRLKSDIGDISPVSIYETLDWMLLGNDEVVV